MDIRDAVPGGTRASTAGMPPAMHGAAVNSGLSPASGRGQLEPTNQIRDLGCREKLHECR